MNWNLAFVAMLLAVFFFGGAKLITDDAVSQELKDNLFNMTQTSPLAVAGFIKSLDELSPTINYKLPFTNKKIFLINEIPMPSHSHYMLMVALLILVGIILNRTNLAFGYQALILLAFIPVGYILSSLLILLIYNLSASNIGMTLAEATTFRRSWNNNLENVVFFPLIFAVVGVIAVVKAYFQRVKKIRSKK